MANLSDKERRLLTRNIQALVDRQDDFIDDTVEGLSRDYSAAIESLGLAALRDVVRTDESGRVIADTKTIRRTLPEARVKLLTSTDIFKDIWKDWDKRLARIDGNIREHFETTEGALLSEGDAAGRAEWTQNELAAIRELRGQWPQQGEAGSGLAGRFFALSDDHRRQLADTITRGVLGRAREPDLVKQMARTTDTTAKRAKFLFDDGTMQYSRAVHDRKAADLGYEHFQYFGPLDKITRPFCRELLGGPGAPAKRIPGPKARKTDDDKKAKAAAKKAAQAEAAAKEAEQKRKAEQAAADKATKEAKAEERKRKAAERKRKDAERKARQEARRDREAAAAAKRQEAEAELAAAAAEVEAAQAELDAHHAEQAKEEAKRKAIEKALEDARAEQAAKDKAKRQEGRKRFEEAHRKRVAEEAAQKQAEKDQRFEDAKERIRQERKRPDEATRRRQAEARIEAREIQAARAKELQAEEDERKALRAQSGDVRAEDLLPAAPELTALERFEIAHQLALAARFREKWEPIPDNAFPRDVAPKNLKQAEQKVRDRIADTVKLRRGWKPEGIDKMIEAVENMNERFAMPKLRHMGNARSFKDETGIKVRNISGAVAAFGAETLFCTRGAFDDDQVAADNATSSEILAHQVDAKKYFASARDPLLKAHLAELEKRGRGEMRWALPESTAKVGQHELGHRLFFEHMNAGGKRILRDHYNAGWHTAVSRYAGTLEAEYQAETVTAYVNGDWDLLPRPVLELYRARDSQSDQAEQLYIDKELARRARVVERAAEAEAREADRPAMEAREAAAAAAAKTRQAAGPKTVKDFMAKIAADMKAQADEDQGKP